jgi:hypothetical protein
MPDDTTTDAEEQAANSADNLQAEPEGWQELVWRAYCKGNRRTGTLRKVSEANGGPRSWHTVDLFIRKQLKALAIASSAEDERVAYEQGLEADLEDGDAILNRAVSENNVNGQVGALRAKMEAREKLAASRGVVTERKAEQHSGTLAITNVDVAAVVDNAAAATAACALLDALGHSADDAGGSGETRSALPVPGGAAPLAAEPEAPRPDSGPDAPPHGDDAAAPREE